MPNWFNNTFEKITVAPDFHKICHHQRQEFTDSNDQLMFIFRDKLFKTYSKLPKSEIKYELEEFGQSISKTWWF